jgi:hypothetical protein
MVKRVDPQQIAKAKAEVELWRTLRDKAKREMEDAQVRVEAGERLLAMLTGDEEIGDSSPAFKMRRGMVKDHVIRLVTENAERGLVAAELVDLAHAQGIELERGSVSSLLSKLKSEGVLDYEDGKYRPAKPSPKMHQAGGGFGLPLSGGTVHAPARNI